MLTSFPVRHGICHGRSDIFCVKFYLPWVKKSFKLTIFFVNSFLVAILIKSVDVLSGPMKPEWRNNGLNVFIEVYMGNRGVTCVFFLAKKVLIYAKFWGKTFVKNMCPCKVCAKFHVCFPCLGSSFLTSLPLPN